MSRQEFDQAWEALQGPVGRVLEQTDAAATVAVCMRLAAHIHLTAAKREGLTLQQARDAFFLLSGQCIGQQEADGSWKAAAAPGEES